MNPDGTGRAVLVAGDIDFGRFSPDGTLIGYIGVEAGHVEVFVMRFDGTDRIRLLRRPMPVWGP